MRLTFCLVIALASAHSCRDATTKGGCGGYKAYHEGSGIVPTAHSSNMPRTYGENMNSIKSEGVNHTLLPLTFEPFPLGTIKPLGWLRQQFELMADGLPGHMHDFYRLVSKSTWSGGDQEYSPLNEAWPYYINGLIPLAYVLDDQRLIQVIQEQISLVLLRQFPDGWLGPEEDVKRRNFWGRYPFFLAAAQYVEAADSAEATTMVKAMHRFVDLMHEMLKHEYQGYVWKDGDEFDEQWGRSRAADMVLALQWLFEHHPGNNADKIHECMMMLYQKAYDWSWWFEKENFLQNDIDSYPPDLTDALFPFLHVVNVAQGLKSPAVMGRLVHDLKLLDSSRRGVDLVLKHKGTPSGAIYGDERLSNNSPKRGTELCSVVEEMFSLSTLYQILGDASFADRLELLAYNALPAMITSDWWAHQYVAETNQPYSYEVKEPPFWNVGPWGITFGLEPNYPCCTVNFPQGYPKLLSNSWVRTPEYRGVAHAILMPSKISTILETDSGGGEVVQNKVYIRCTTKYPFSHELTYDISVEHALNFSFRVPEWVNPSSEDTYIELIEDSAPASHFADESGHQIPLKSTTQPSYPHKLKLHQDSHSGLHTILIPPGKSTYHVLFAAKQSQSSPVQISHPAPLTTTPKQPRLQRPIVHTRPNSAVSLTYGALLFAHSLPAERVPRQPEHYPNPRDAPPQANDWTIVPRDEMEEDEKSSARSRTSLPWNIAIDPSTAVVHENPDLDDNTLWDETSETPPVSISVLACEIEWGLSHPVEYEDVEDEDGKVRKRPVRGGVPLDPPESTEDPRTGKKGLKCIGRAFTVRLRPYGTSKIRIAEFPVVDLSPGSSDLVDLTR